MTEFLPDKHALFMAAKFGDWSKVQEILSKNDQYLYVKDQNGQNFLHIAAIENQIILVKNTLATFPAFDIRQEDENGRTIAHIAAEKGYINFFEEALIPKYKSEVSVLWNFKNSDGQSLLHWSAIGDQQEMTSFLLDRKLDANLLDHNNKTPIHYSIKYGANSKFTIFYKFLEKVEIFEPTILHEAVLVESIELVKYIIQVNGAEALINCQDIDGNTPFTIAIKADKPEMAERLIENFDVNVDINEYYDPVRKENLRIPHAAHLAINKNYIKLFELIKEKSEQKDIAKVVDGANSTILHHAVSSGNKAAVEYVISNYPEIIDYKDTKYGTALNTAIRGVYIDINTYDELNAFGKNSAFIESMRDITKSNLDENLINLLIAKGMDINGFNDLPEENLLINACKEGRTKIVYILIKAGAKIFPKECQEEYLSEVRSSNSDDANAIGEVLNCGRIADSIYRLEGLDKSAKKIEGDLLKNILFERMKTQLVKIGYPVEYDCPENYCKALEEYIILITLNKLI